MIFKCFTRISNIVKHLHKRNFYSARVNTLFVNNYEKYLAKLQSETKDESFHITTRIKNLLEEFKQLSDSIRDVEKELCNENGDKELITLMKEEREEQEAQKNELIESILNEIYNFEQMKDTDRIHDNSNVIFEVSAGVGGKEAMLFVNDILTLYLNYFQYKNWEIKEVESDDVSGVLRHYHAKVEGRDVWGHMKYEAGVHRVQRVPETERQGRIHTSTVSIACIPITKNIMVEVHEKDLKIQTKTSTGAGGQHVNKTESAIRMTHIPSGVIVECQEDRSQIKNREIAIRKLRKILTDRFISETFEKFCKTRKSQIGQANRNEKIRTFNFNQDRVTDHRLSSLNIAASEKEDTLYDLEGFFSNPEKLDRFINNLQKVDKERELLDILTKLEK